MKQYLAISFRAARRATYIIASILISAATLPLLFNSGSASALQLQSRSIEMSDSAASGGTITSGVGSGANVTYNVTFTTSATESAASMIIDFCQANPIINDTCGSLTGFNASGATLNATATSGTVQTTTDNWAVTATADQIKLADDNTTGPVVTTSPHDMQTSTTESFSLSGITNPSAANCSPTDGNCTFYARIYTYNDNGYGTSGTVYTAPTSVGSYVDYGGFALSTTNPITIQATVQEQLTFCLSGTTATSWSPAGSTSVDGCTATTGITYPALTLGHGSPTLILDSTAVDNGYVWSDLSTNATHGAVINMRNSNLTCTGAGGAGGLSADNGSTCAIPPMNNPVSGTPVAITAGTADFGMTCMPFTVAGAGTNGTVNCTADYYAATHGPGAATPYYGMDTSNGSDGSVVGPYGSEIATTTGPTYNAYNEYDFGATASLTTPAGIYAANLSVIATGTF